MSVSVVGVDYAAIECQTERLRTEPSRPMTALEEKMRGSIKGVMEYSDGPRFKEDVSLRRDYLLTWLIERIRQMHHSKIQ